MNEKFIKIIENEFENFKKELETKNGQEICDIGEKIYFINYFVTDFKMFTEMYSLEKAIKKLLNLKEKENIIIIEYIYNIYLNMLYDNLTSETINEIMKEV